MSALESTFSYLQFLLIRFLSRDLKLLRNIFTHYIYIAVELITQKWITKLVPSGPPGDSFLSTYFYSLDHYYSL